MAELAEEDYAWIRVQIGDTIPPTDTDLQVIYERLETRVDVAHEVLSKRLANLLASPASVSIGGKISRNTAANIEGLRKDILRLEAHPDFSGVRSTPSGSQPVTYAYPVKEVYR